MRFVVLLMCVVVGLFSGGFARSAGAVELEAPAAAPAVVRPIVAYVPIEGEINPAKATYFKRALEQAKEKKVTHLLVHLTTPGGQLGAGMDMMNAALDVPKDAPRLIAFVDDHSLSAGSMIAYGHDEILVTPKAMLGDIGVITMSSDGKIEYLPEKIETVVRALLRNAAQNRGWNQAKLVKMTARTQDLYRFTLDGKDEYVIQDDLSAWLAAHPGVSTDSKVVVLGTDRLLSYTAREAVEAGMATALVNDLDAAYARLGVKAADVVDLSPSATEEMAWSLATIAPMLAALALLFIFLEFKVPLGGLWLIGAAAAGIGFFVCQFYMDLANYLEVTLIILGLVLIVVEFLVLPLAGMFAAAGFTLLLTGLILAFMPTATQFTPSAVGWSDTLKSAMTQASFAIAVVTAGTIAMLFALPKLALHTGLADAAAIDGTSAGSVEAAAVSLVGQRGVTRTLLRPGGQVDVAGQLFNAVTEQGDFIQAGAPVEVVAARFGELIVKPADGSVPADGSGQV